MKNAHHGAQQQRLRAAVKRLVIELGYLERCMDEGLLNPNVQAAALHLDSAVDHLNDFLSSGGATQRAA